jgi:hypothetical protein
MRVLGIYDHVFPSIPERILGIFGLSLRDRVADEDRRRSGQYDHVFSSIPKRVLETFRVIVSLIALE